MSANKDLLAINTIRTLSMDAVQQANSGHPGTPMALAPVAYCLWQRFLRYDPRDPLWPNRDRFVLSVGHASMLLYSLLHLSGVRRVDHTNGKQLVTDDLAIPLDAIKNFRQLNSVCAGHPESHLASGIETTTGPLGQGLANSVGMAVAAQWQATHFNRPGFDIFDYDTYALCGDGCLMEGVSAEAASLAGHLKLGNLCWIYDSNNITIEGSTNLAFTEDVAKRFTAYGWHVSHVSDANDLTALEKSFQSFRDTNDRPTLIIVKSHIAWGAPNKQDTHGAHGSPLGEEEIRLTKEAYGWPNETFLVPGGVHETFRNQIGQRGKSANTAWRALVERYTLEHAELATQLGQMNNRTLPPDCCRTLPTFEASEKGVATRNTSGQVLNAFAEQVPWVIGGSADLAPSTKTMLTFDSARSLSAEAPGGRNIHFGVREHAMASMLNGMALCNVRPYGSGFLIFSDYARPAIRLASLMEIPVVHIFTHDSISVGEDGPTHQPVEQIASLRAIPGLIVLRPADANEVRDAWQLIATLDHTPVALCLTRQAVPTFDRSRFAKSDVAKGAYILSDVETAAADVILIGTGSEVSLCVEAAAKLTQQGHGTRVVSMPSWELFEQQPESYRNHVLPPNVRARVSVEQGTTFGWERYVGLSGKAIGIDQFGASGPAAQVQAHFGFTVDHVVEAAKKQISKKPAKRTT